MKKKKRNRNGAGRPPYSEERKKAWGRITVVLKHETIRALKKGADSRFVGEFLQHHLDRFPVPSHEQYQAYLDDPSRFAVIQTAERERPVEKVKAPTTVRQALLQVKRNLKGSGRHFESVL